MVDHSRESRTGSDGVAHWSVGPVECGPDLRANGGGMPALNMPGLLCYVDTRRATLQRLSLIVFTCEGVQCESPVTLVRFTPVMCMGCLYRFIVA